MRPYTPANWFWIVGGDDTRAWSSAASAYVAEWPDDAYSRIGTEVELGDVLRPLGMRGPALSADDVRRECQRRIFLLMGVDSMEKCVIKQLNANMRANQLNDKRARGETLTAQEEATAASLRALAAEVQRLRDCSNVMEPDPPGDYMHDSRWS